MTRYNGVILIFVGDLKEGGFVHSTFENDASVAKINTNDATENVKTWLCLVCGWIYDEKQGAPAYGIAPSTAWTDVPMNWTCPECGARKEDFEMIEF